MNLDDLNNDPWSTYPVKKDELRKLAAAMHRCIEHMQEMEGILCESLDWLERYEDVLDGDFGMPEPNEAVILADRIRKVLLMRKKQ